MTFFSINSHASSPSVMTNTPGSEISHEQKKISTKQDGGKIKCRARVNPVGLFRPIPPGLKQHSKKKKKNTEKIIMKDDAHRTGNA